MDDLTTERSVDSQVRGVIGVLGLFFDMLSMGVCTTKHCQTSGRLVQKLNVCTVESVIDHCAIRHSTQPWGLPRLR